jgi:hypothetical protein
MSGRTVAAVLCLDCSRDLDHCHGTWLVVDDLCTDPGCRLPLEAHALVVTPT